MNEPNPFTTVLQIAGGYCLPRCLHIVADLGVADALDDAPRTAAEIAESVGAHPDALGRALRLLAAHGVFEAHGDTFRHSPSSRLLRSDHPQSLRAFARMIGLPINWAIYGALDHTLRTGQPAAEKVLPGGLWAYYAEHPEEAAIFSAAMAGKAHGQVAGVIAAYDFASFKRIGDIGGGRGHLLQAVLDCAPSATGVLFDLPHVTAEASDLASERLSLQAGDFFHDALPSCDAYVLMEIIHDWGDEEALAILQAVRRAAPAHARLLVIEQMVPDDPGPHWSKMVDIHMLTLIGGRQRTQQEYAALFERAGFCFERQIDTRADISILEAVAV
ncbi:MAG TPA: methyltransferase [Roseiflexaceae bacterium]|nr:methyltransferase [Roseiflexaceae bacterium]